jgi:hypothetical protein
MESLNGFCLSIRFGFLVIFSSLLVWTITGLVLAGLNIGRLRSLNRDPNLEGLPKHKAETL